MIHMFAKSKLHLINWGHINKLVIQQQHLNQQPLVYLHQTNTRWQSMHRYLSGLPSWLYVNDILHIILMLQTLKV